LNSSAHSRRRLRRTELTPQVARVAAAQDYMDAQTDWGSPIAVDV
jgi:hypothetical protein